MLPFRLWQAHAQVVAPEPSRLDSTNTRIKQWGVCPPGLTWNDALVVTSPICNRVVEYYL